MRLPNSEKAYVDSRKLSEYSLSPNHPVGKHKAVIFQRLLGLTVDDADLLRTWLLEAAQSDDAVIGDADEYGQRYQIEFQARTSTGEAIVRSAWIIRTGEDNPRLVSCYIP